MRIATTMQIHHGLRLHLQTLTGEAVNALGARPDDQELIVPDEEIPTGSSTSLVRNRTSIQVPGQTRDQRPLSLVQFPSTFSPVSFPKKPRKYKDTNRVSRAAFARREYTYPSYNVLTPPRAHGDLESAAASSPSAPVFLAHARLYTLADAPGVSTARTRTTQAAQGLGRIQTPPRRLGDVAELARYAL